MCCRTDLASHAVQAVQGYYVDGVSTEFSTPSFVVFLDEVNTSSILGSVQDVLMDNSLEGKALPNNIFWVCATNPYRAVAQAVDPNSAASGDVAFRAHYQVSKDFLQ